MKKYKLNSLGWKLYNKWYENYCKENDRLGGNSTEGNFVEGWTIIDNKDYIKTLTDECGLLIFAYQEMIFGILDEWSIGSKETDKICGGFTIAEVRQELIKYFEEV